VVVSRELLGTYKRNHRNHNEFQSREQSLEINRFNERMFYRLQEIHSVSLVAPT